MLNKQYFCRMRRNFTTRISFNGKAELAVIIPQHRKDGMYYEVNINGYPRFYMTWSAYDRYDLAEKQPAGLPYDMLLAVSDAIEEEVK